MSYFMLGSEYRTCIMGLLCKNRKGYRHLNIKESGILFRQIFFFFFFFFYYFPPLKNLSNQYHEYAVSQTLIPHRKKSTSGLLFLLVEDRCNPYKYSIIEITTS